MGNSVSITNNIRSKNFLFIIFTLGINFCTLSYAGSYETNKAVEYYNNGEYKRAESILKNTDIFNDPAATYMMGAIALQNERTKQDDNLDMAIHWFELSSKLNNPQAYRALGISYEQRWLNNRQYNDFIKSQESYSHAIYKGVELASLDLKRLNSRHKDYYKEKPKAKHQPINQAPIIIDPQPILATTSVEQPVSPADPQTIIPRSTNITAEQAAENQEQSKNDGLTTVSQPGSDSETEIKNSPSGFSFGIGMGIPYGIIGANMNYQINETFDVTVGAGLGFGAGIRYHPSEVNNKLRLMLFYGDNIGFLHPTTDEIETFSGMNFGIGYGSISDGWDFDLIYALASDEAIDRVNELESQGYRLTSGDTDDAIKISFGYHW